MSPNRGTVLIVEDDTAAAELLSELVRDEGFMSVLATTGNEAMEAFKAQRPVAILLDWVLPDISGIEACRVFRQLDPMVPIIFVSGRDDEASAIRGLDAGGDDYLSKPIRIRELIARLEAHLRKVEAARGVSAPAPPEMPSRTKRYGSVEVDFAARRVRVDGEEVTLAPLEFSLLEYLGRNSGVAVSRDQIIREVYGFPGDISTERVDQLVRRLRQKLGEGADRAGVIVAVPGYGYRLEPAASPASTAQ